MPTPHIPSWREMYERCVREKENMYEKCQREKVELFQSVERSVNLIQKLQNISKIDNEKHQQYMTDSQKLNENNMRRIEQQERTIADLEFKIDGLGNKFVEQYETIKELENENMELMVENEDFELQCAETYTNMLEKSERSIKELTDKIDLLEEVDSENHKLFVEINALKTTAKKEKLKLKETQQQLKSANDEIHINNAEAKEKQAKYKVTQKKNQEDIASLKEEIDTKRHKRENEREQFNATIKKLNTSLKHARTNAVKTARTIRSQMETLKEEVALLKPALDEQTDLVKGQEKAFEQLSDEYDIDRFYDTAVTPEEYDYIDITDPSLAARMK